METGCIPESSASFACVIPFCVLKYFIFSPMVIIATPILCSLVTTILLYKNRKIYIFFIFIKNYLTKCSDDAIINNIANTLHQN